MTATWSWCVAALHFSCYGSFVCSNQVHNCVWEIQLASVVKSVCALINEVFSFVLCLDVPLATCIQSGLELIYRLFYMETGTK